MPLKDGNPNGIGDSMDSANVPTFESVAKALGLAPKDYEGSIPLREWAKRNRDHRFVPPDLLEAWGLPLD
jgi:hypothetical protein